MQYLSMILFAIGIAILAYLAYLWSNKDSSKKKVVTKEKMSPKNETYAEVKARHKKELEELQLSCTHDVLLITKTKNLYMCEICGKTVEVNFGDRTK